MGIIKDRFKAKADAANAEIKDLLKEHGTKKIGEVTLAQIYQGMRGITGLVTETSLVDILFLIYKKNYQKLTVAMSLYRKVYSI